MRGKKSFKIYVKFTTIQLTDCYVREAKLLDDNESLERDPIHRQLYIGQKIITYDNKYDVYFEDKVTCGKKECKFSIDAKGNIIRINQLHSRIIAHIIQLISKNKPSEVFTSLKMNKNEAILTIIKPTISEKLVATIDSKQNIILGYSVERETVDLCIRLTNKSSIICSQYDIDGNLKTKVTLSDTKTHLPYMYVLRDGGFFLLRSVNVFLYHQS